MNILSIVLARKNSKRIQNKNRYVINNKPLIKYTIDSVNNSKLINKCFLFTDDQYLKRYCKKKVNYVKRPKCISGDKISSEAVIIYFLKNILEQNEEEEIIVFLQATSPSRKKEDIDLAINQFIKKRYDSLFSAYKDKSLYWMKEKKKIVPINYNPLKRKREQNMKNQYIENGSIYIFYKKKFLEKKCRIYGKIGMYLMNKIDSFQLDTKEDIEILKKIL